MRAGRLLAGFAMIVAAAGAAGCGPKDPSSLHIVNLRVEVSPNGRPPELLFAVDNALPAPDSLVSVTSPDADRVTAADDRTWPTGGSVALPAESITRFEGSGTRLRLDRRRRQLEQGDQVQVTFAFGSGTVITLLAPVIAAGSPAPGEGHR